MPLSDHEQRLLDQIEQALYAEDPKFASAVRSARSRSRTRRAVVLGVLGVLVGLALVLVGLSVTVIPLSVVGFLLIVGACYYAWVTLRKRPAGTPNSPGAAGPSSKIKSGGLRTRMEDRMRRRFDES